jgi:hypothetical protein
MLTIVESLQNIEAKLHRMTGSVAGQERVIISHGGQLTELKRWKDNSDKRALRFATRLERLEALVAEEQLHRGSILEILDRLGEEAKADRLAAKEDRLATKEEFGRIHETLGALLRVNTDMLTWQQQTRSEHIRDVMALADKVKVPGTLTKALWIVVMALGAMVSGFVSSMVWPDIDRRLHAAWTAAKTALGG